MINFESSMTFGFSSFTNFIWAFTQSVAPILMIIGIYFKPFKIGCSVALYCYGLQLIWIFSPEHSDDFLGYVFALGVYILFMIIIFFINRLIDVMNKQKNKDQEFIQDAKETLELLKLKIIENSNV